MGIESSHRGLLYIPDTFYPGWRAYIDGREIEILRANFNFRALAIPDGQHQLEVKYQPVSFTTGVKISLLSLVGILLSYLLSFGILRRQ